MYSMSFYSGEARIESSDVNFLYETVQNRWPDWHGFFQMGEDDKLDHLIVWENREASEEYKEPVAIITCDQGMIRKSWGTCVSELKQS